MVKVTAIIQARMSSARLPAKMMLSLGEKTVLENVIDRVKLSEEIDDIWVATSTHKEDDLIEKKCGMIGIPCYRGSLEYVISRFAETALKSKADIIVRITGDNPLAEPSFIDQAVKEIMSNGYDYVGVKNNPIGSGIEAFTNKSFQNIIGKRELTDHNIEHVTSFYYQNSELFQLSYIDSQFTKEQAEIRITIDTLEDYVNLYQLYSELMKKQVNPKNYLKYVVAKHKLSL